MKKTRKEATPEQKAKAAERKAKLREICKQIKALDEGERARMASRMQVSSIAGTTLSTHNQCMLAFQKPDCTIVGGFRQWKQNGRSVMKGERGLGIWFPRFSKEKEKSGDTAGEIEGFMFGTVFDVMQTEEIKTA